jgi:prephenate dehydrogenase
MPAKIAIIGLGQIGASFGLALRGRPGSPRVVGFDKERETRRSAEARGAVDSIESMADAVHDAEIVILCLPLGQIGEALKRIGPGLKGDAIVLETAPVKGPVLKWVRESLPAGRHYIGLVPSVNPSLLAAPEKGISGARADLFQRTVMIIAAPPNTPDAIQQVVMNVARLLGAKPLLADLTEADGIMTTAHVLPELAAAALVEASVDGPGWMETRQLAGRPFAQVTGGAAYFDDAASLEIAALANPTTVLHALDVLIASLQGMREDIQRGDKESVSERLAHSFGARERWLDERGGAEWLGEGGHPVEIPELGEQMMRALFGGKIVDRHKQPKTGRGW